MAAISPRVARPNVGHCKRTAGATADELAATVVGPTFLASRSTASAKRHLPRALLSEAASPHPQLTKVIDDGHVVGTACQVRYRNPLVRENASRDLHLLHLVREAQLPLKVGAKGPDMPALIEHHELDIGFTGEIDEDQGVLKPNQSLREQWRRSGEGCWLVDRFYPDKLYSEFSA